MKANSGRGLVARKKEPSDNNSENIPRLQNPAERQYMLAETARLLLCVLVSALGFYVIALLCHHFYHPDITAFIESSKNVLPAHLVNSVKPEPLENLLYNIGLLYFPLSLLGLYALSVRKKVNRLLSSPGIATISIYFVCASLLCLGVFTLSQPNPFAGAGLTVTDKFNTNFKVFFGAFLIVRKPLLYIVFIPTILGLFFLLNKLKPKAYKWVDLTLGVLVSVWVLWLLTVIFRMQNYSFPETWQGQYDLNAVYYSQTQTMAGQPVLINGVSNTYGGYPLFLAPIFKLIGFDVAHFTLVMSLLIVGAVLCWGVFLNRFSRSRVIVSAGMVTLLFFGYLTPYLYDNLFDSNTFDSYFANAPIRWVSPALTLLLATLYGSHKRNLRRVVYYVAVLILPLGIVWCPDFGLISYVAWLLFLLFQDFWVSGESLPRVAWRTEGRHIAVWFCGLLVSFGLLSLILHFAYGAWPDYRLLFRTAAVFGKIGFFTLPMQACHPWILVVLVFCMGLVYSMSAFYRRRVTSHTAAVFLLSVMGCGMFAYFKARSYHNNLFQPALYAIMIGVMFTDMLWEQVREKGVRQLWCPCAIGLLLTCVFVPESLAAVKTLQRLTRPYHGFAKAADGPRIYENKSFIRQYADKTDKVWVLTSNKYQSLYFDKPILQSAFNPGFLDLNMLEDFNRAKHTMRDSSFTVFLDGGSFYYGEWKDLRAMLAARYTIDRQLLQSNQMFFSALNPRRAEIPLTRVLERQGENSLLYRKYKDTTTDYELRVKDVEGIPLDLSGKTFSVEAIFYTSPQHYPNSVLFAQDPNGQGFGFFHTNGNAGQNNLFVLVCNSSQIALRLPMSAWHYLNLNFLSDAVDIYLNGKYAGRIPMKEPCRTASDKFFIGAYEGGANYFGAISEVAVYGRPKTAGEIKETFEIMKGSLK
ncbi:MAG: LamG domain-containing protein [Bacteroides sp.]|nr:LamG domain-containing protein [Ruminococcus flavefaciens]MCM1554475.1 LamG domain-containing protein [Bacteroides sp.]